MRHVALKVKNVAQSKTFYREILGMDVVWEPDAENSIFLQAATTLRSTLSRQIRGERGRKAIDHLGFIVESTERVKELEAEFIAKGASFTVQSTAAAAASFYCADPDGIVIQMLYERHLSVQRIE